MTCREREPLSTFHDVLNALGGFHGIAKLGGVSKPAVYHWARDGKFPAWMFDRIDRHLIKRGLFAKRELFDFQPPRSKSA